MATLKDTLIQGNIRVTDTLLSEAIKTTTLASSGGSFTGDLVFNSATATGDTPKISFVRGTVNTETDNAQADWNIYNSSGHLVFSSDYTNKANMPIIEFYPNSSGAVTGIFPGTTELYDLGSSSSKWNNIYASTLHGSLALSAITEATNLQAIEALTGTSGYLKKTAANTWVLDTNVSGGVNLISQTAQVYLTGATATTDSDIQLTTAYVTTAGALYSTTVHNAVWNDYAEYRAAASYIEPGRVVIDTDNGEVILATKRLQPGAQIVSDTWGHIMGETNAAKTPLAVAGRVLVYPYKDRKEYHAGMCVCSAPNGTVDIMTREEIKEYPDCIIGTVSEIPEYEYWGSGNVKINGRIWVKVR